MKKSLRYYFGRAYDRALHRMVAIGQPSGSRYALSTFPPEYPGDTLPPRAGAETAFVFQGPVSTDFRQTFSVYKALFPASPIIVSTWDNEYKKLDWLTGETQAKAVFQSRPAMSGIMNVNLQICSTGRGIAFARDEYPHVKRVAKIRMDFPPRRPDAIFPIIDHFDAYLGRSRIWGLDINTMAHLPFSFSDIFQIGPISEMSQFWRTDALDDRTITPTEFLERTAQQTNIDAIIALQPAEIFLTCRYLRTRGVSFAATSIDDYRTSLIDFFGILDADQIGLAFDKYSLWRAGRHMDQTSHRRFVSFPQWLDMVTGEEQA